MLSFKLDSKAKTTMVGWVLIWIAAGGGASVIVFRLWAGQHRTIALSNEWMMSVPITFLVGAVVGVPIATLHLIIRYFLAKRTLADAPADDSDRS